MADTENLSVSSMPLTASEDMRSEDVVVESAAASEDVDAVKEDMSSDMTPVHSTLEAVTSVEPVSAPPPKSRRKATVAPKSVREKAVKPRVVAKGAKGGAAKVATPKVASPPAETPSALHAKPDFAGLFTPFMLKEADMTMNANFSGFQDAISEVQAKAKAAFEKSSSVLGEVSEFTKGNVEAVVESGKILASGVQGLGSELVTESRSAFETMTSDIKELASVKSPTDFFKLQSEMARKNFDNAVAYSSKNTEAMLKLFSDSFAPISGRMSLAMEKARSASL